jgi:Fe-S-cluster-containing dehydrogenase component
MMKCDMCYDRTSVGMKPMCATVCPSGALAWGRREEIQAQRREQPIRVFEIGAQVVRTRVQMMAPAGMDQLELDVTVFMAG